MPPRQRPRRAVPFRRSLITNLTLGVLCLGVAMIVTSLVAAGRAVEKLSGSLTSRIIATMDARLEVFFEPVHFAIEISAERFARGDFVEWDLNALDEHFAPLIDGLPQLSSLMLADGNGDEYMLLSSRGEWGSRHTRPASQAGEELWREWTDPAGPKSEERRDSDYDARVRPWFTGALDRYGRLGAESELRDRVHWTQPYRFFTTKEPGVTASLAFPTAANRTGILGFDILLTDISRYTTDLRIGEEGKVFVLRGDPADPTGIVVIGLPNDPRFATLEDIAEHVLQAPSEIGGPVADFVARSFGARSHLDGEPVPFESNGEAWWGAAVQSRLRSSEDLWVGAVVPERELLEGLPPVNRIVLGTTAIVVLLATLRSLSLARSYSAPVDELVRVSERMQRLNFEPGDPVDASITEIRQLASTLDGMRQALHAYSSVKEDLRVARSIRKASLPGELPTLTGFEVAAWHEPSAEVGGEGYDALALEDEGGTAFLLYDVAGSGVHSALHGAELRSVFRSGVCAGARTDELMARMNTFLRGLPAAPLTTAWIGWLDESEATLVSTGGGHDPALHFVAAEDAVRELGPGSLPLGQRDEYVAEPMVAAHLAPGDIVVVASDGVVDASNVQRERFGSSGVRRILESHRQESAPEIASALRDALVTFTEGADPSGDRTVLVLKRSLSSRDRCSTRPTG